MKGHHSWNLFNQFRRQRAGVQAVATVYARPGSDIHGPVASPRKHAYCAAPPFDDLPAAPHSNTLRKAMDDYQTHKEHVGVRDEVQSRLRARRIASVLHSLHAKEVS